MGFFGTGDDDSVHVKRRRPDGPADTGPRERAEAPRRRRSEGSGTEEPAGGGPSGQGTGGTGGGGLRRTMRRPMSTLGGGKGCSGLPLHALFLVIIVVGICMLLQGPIELISTPTQIEPAEQIVTTTRVVVAPTRTPAAPLLARPTATMQPTVTARPTTAATTGGWPLLGRPTATSPRGDTWTVMLYQDADDKVLEQDIYFDLNEAERVGSTDRVHIVAQMDRFRGGFSGDGNWTTAKRFYLTRDDDLDRVRSGSVDLGEINMSDPNNLIDFVTWAVREYPADKYALILSDHGMGWPGALTDPDPKTRIRTSVPIAQAMGNLTYLADLDAALGEIRARTGIDKFEIIGLDACLMSHIEVYNALAPHARYAVASQETEPGLGWAYTGFLSGLAKAPDMSGADLGRLIVNTYIEEDQRIVDEQARAEYMRQGSPMGNLFELLLQPSSDTLAERTAHNATLTAIDLEFVPQLMDSINALSNALVHADPSSVARARNYAQPFTSIFGAEVPPSYIDLGSLALLAERFTGDEDVAKAVNDVLRSLQAAVVAEKHGPDRAGATGVSIYFPISQLYRSAVAGPQSYTAVASRFAQDSLWDDFLAHYFAGRSFEPTARAAAIPDAGARSLTPGGGGIQLGPVQLSDDRAAPGEPVRMRAKVTGENVGYAYVFAGYLDAESNSIYVADMDYLESPSSRVTGGVTYPDWGDRGSFTLDFDWEPLMFAITDGKTTAQTLLTPRSYGRSPEDAVYTVDGIYTFSDGTTRSARLYFRNGILRQVFGFSNSDFTGAPAEITPHSGDQFIVLEEWMDLDSQGKVKEVVRLEGSTLTFGATTFTWKTLDAAVGDYVIGFIVEDLDGNSYESYAAVEVQ
ncbi:MAG TPA: hypothetical protein DCM67_13575 [Propionibacteriaceae bacterium]|nr:hypothetical protein [Propionibacteriaceae bacterium]